MAESNQAMYCCCVTLRDKKKIREETNNKKRKKKHKENKDGMCVSNDGSSICTCEMPFSFF